MKSANKYLLCLVFVLSFTPVSFADYMTDIGYADLKALLGASMPTGAGVKVMQVEAGETAYAPNTTSTQFAGKTFRFPRAA